MLELHAEHGQLAKRVNNAVRKTCQEERPGDDGDYLPSLAGYELRDLRWSIYRGASDVHRYLRDELRHA